MRIRWDNIFGLLLLIFLIYLFFKFKPVLERMIDDLRYGSSYSHDPIWTFNILALLCLTLIVMAVFISRR